MIFIIIIYLGLESRIKRDFVHLGEDINISEV